MPAFSGPVQESVLLARIGGAAAVACAPDRLDVLADSARAARVELVAVEAELDHGVGAAQRALILQCGRVQSEVAVLRVETAVTRPRHAVTSPRHLTLGARRGLAARHAAVPDEMLAARARSAREHGVAAAVGAPEHVAVAAVAGAQPGLQQDELHVLAAGADGPLVVTAAVGEQHLAGLARQPQAAGLAGGGVEDEHGARLDTGRGGLVQQRHTPAQRLVEGEQVAPAAAAGDLSSQRGRRPAG